MGAGNAGGNNSGDKDTYNPVTGKQYSKPKNKAKKDREEKKMTEEFDVIDKEIAKAKTTTPKDINRDNEKVIVPKKKPVAPKIVTPKKVEREDNNGGNNNTTTPKPKVPVIPKVDTAPTTAEVDQSSATDTTTVKEDDIYTRKRKTKARGRSMMTLTSAQGVKKDDNLILGRRSLLGS